MKNIILTADSASGRKLAILILLAMSAVFAAPIEAQSSDTYFPYPTAPESGSLRERCNYVVTHFWDRCNFKTAFSHIDKMNIAMYDFLGYMPHTQADTAHMAVERLLDKVKKDPKATLALARMAEGWIYCDTARYVSEELYAPFAAAVASNKKIPAADRARFEAQHKILTHSQTGMIWPAIKLKDVAGVNHTMDEYTTPNVIVMFSDPDCTDCMMARARLSGDVNANALIDQGLLTIIAIYPGEAADLADHAADYPSNWQLMASEDADEYFALPNLPMLVYLNPQRKIVGKNLAVDNLKEAFRLLNQEQK